MQWDVLAQIRQILFTSIFKLEKQHISQNVHIIGLCSA